MDNETLKALRGSIAKWEAIVAGTETDKGAENCPLCQMFSPTYERLPDRCAGCPVRDETGIRGCVGSPYDTYSDLSDELNPESSDADRAAVKAAAQAELDFLKSLLPVERQVVT